MSRTNAAPAAPAATALAVKPKRACEMLDCGLTHLYALLAARELVSYKDGRSRKILVSSIHDRIAKLVAENSKAASAGAGARP